MKMFDYRKKVRDAAVRRDGHPLYNGSIDHASVLTEALFEFSNNEVCILTGGLDAHVYGNNEVIEKARAFLSVPNRKVRILVETPSSIDVIDHPFIREFNDSDDVEIRKISEVYDISQHFTVMDGDSYRFEEDKTKYSAVAAFGHREGGEHLLSIFDEIWRSSPDKLSLVN